MPSLVQLFLIKLMDIITRIPPAWFIHLEDDSLQFSCWINLAQVIRVEDISSTLHIHLQDNHTIIIDGKTKADFLTELEALKVRYGTTIA
jgi:hypothetical protein